MYKFLTTMLSLKIRGRLYPETKQQNGVADLSITTFDHFLKHLVSADKPQSYDYYERCSRILQKVSRWIMQGCKNEEFMLRQEEQPVLLEGVPSLELIVFQRTDITKHD